MWVYSDVCCILIVLLRLENYLWFIIDWFFFLCMWIWRNEVENEDFFDFLFYFGFIFLFLLNVWLCKLGL